FTSGPVRREPPELAPLSPGIVSQNAQQQQRAQEPARMAARSRNPREQRQRQKSQDRHPERQQEPKLCRSRRERAASSDLAHFPLFPHAESEDSGQPRVEQD